MPILAQSVAELAATPSVRAALDWFRKERAWINEQHLKLCRIPAPTFFEQKRAAWMAEQFKSLGWEAKIDRAGNVVASLSGRDRPAIAVTAHLDTVLAPRTPDEIKVGDEGRFLGPGVSDNATGLTALLALAAVWNTKPPFEETSSDEMKHAPLLIANVGEEGEGNLSGMRYICRAANSANLRAFLVLDGPSLDHITSQALASRRYEVSITGPGGHSWTDHGTGNPVHALSRAITIFSDDAGARRPAADDAGGSKTASPRFSFNVGVIEGGVSINSIPSEARAKIDLRSENPERLEHMAAQIGSAVERAVEIENARGGAKVTGRVKEIGSRPGGGLREDSPLLECIRAVDSHLGIRSHLGCSSTDANVPLSLGIPAISIGAGGQGGGAHTPGEWYQPDGREIGLQRVLLALCMLLISE